jgi:hypothetical protein
VCIGLAFQIVLRRLFAFPLLTSSLYVSFED